MKNNIKITIPEPCHENWLEMTPTEKGRFCSNCQKNVIDFTKASDREILIAYTKNNSLCGRFNNAQLNRNIMVPKEKNSFWMIAAASIITFLGLGEQSVKAQEATKTEQTDKKLLKLDNTIAVDLKGKTKYSGVIYDDTKTPFPGVSVMIKGTKINTQTNFDGEFSILANKNDILVFTYIGFHKIEFKLQNESKLSITMKGMIIIGEFFIVEKKPEDEYIEF